MLRRHGGLHLQAALISPQLNPFGTLLPGGPFRCTAEWHTIFANLWAIWLHRNEVVFRGRSPSVDAIQHDARGIALLLESRRLRPLELCTSVTDYLFCFITLMKSGGGSAQGTPFAVFQKKKQICLICMFHKYLKLLCYCIHLHDYDLDKQ